MLRSSILVSLVSLLGSIISFTNQLVLARLFGASMSMDVYLIAVSLPMLVSGVLSAALSYSLVPTLMIYKSDATRYRHFNGLLLVSFVILAIIISLTGIILAPAQIEILGKPLSALARLDAVAIARVSWLSVGAVLIIGQLNAICNIESSFLLPVFVGIVPFIGMLIAGLFFATTYGILAIAWGLLGGYLVAIPILLFQKYSSLRFTTESLLLRGDVVKYLTKVPLISLSMLCFTVFQSIDAFWAPGIGIGKLAYLGYSQRMLVAIGSLVIAGPAAVMLPRLSEAFADGRIIDLLKDTQLALRMILAVAMPIVICTSVLAKPLVVLLFQRGAFDQQATSGVVSILPLMMLGMLSMLCVVMIFKALFAKQDNAIASIIGISTSLLYFGFSGLFSQLMGVIGIAFAYALSWMLVLALSVLTLWRGYWEMLLRKGCLIFVAKHAVLLVVTGSVTLVGKLWIDRAEVGAKLLFCQLLLVMASAGIVYLTVALRIVKLQEVQLIFTFFFKPKILGMVVDSET
jgi:putative peptidoglycan lipid II flippase